MYSLRKWMFKPKKPDESVLAEFFYADEELNLIAAELDSFDGRKDPERCTSLVNQLRHCQDKVLVVVERIIQHVVPERRSTRDFRVKFPDDVLQDNLAGQLWFGAECLAAGSSIMNREVESASMRPLARALTKQLDVLRSLLRDQCLRDQYTYGEKITESLVVFDQLFAEFELSYVSAMVPVKTMKEYDMLQEVTILFCETVQRALKLELLHQDMIDAYDPALMFTIPRLAIVCGLLVYPEGPINPDMDPMKMSEMFRPFQMLLYKIRELLWTLSRSELWLLEKALSSSDDNILLTDRTFEEQLNQLNSLQQLNKQTHYCGNHGNTLTMTDGVSGYVSHSQSTLTIVASSDLSETEASIHGEYDGETCSHSDCDREACSHGNCDNEAGGLPTESDNLLHCDSEVSNHGSNDMEACSLDNHDTKASNHGDIEEMDSTSAEVLQRVWKNPCVPHQDSSDSGMLSLSDHVTASPNKALATITRRCCASRLRRSQSWPPHSHSTVGSLRSQRHSICCDSLDNIGSMELLQCCHLVDSVQHVAYTQSMGSREFQFHLPRNTSRHHSRTEESATEGHDYSRGKDLINAEGVVDSQNSPSVAETSQNEQVDVELSQDNPPSLDVVNDMSANASRIIYTQNGREDNTPVVNSISVSDEDNPSTQIAFITGALNNFFFTDPAFQGVAPPRNSSTLSCRKSHGKSRGHRHSQKTNRSVSSNICPMCHAGQDEINIPATNPDCDQTVRSERGTGMPQPELCSKHNKSCRSCGNKDPTRCGSSSSSLDYEWDRESYTSSDTSSYTSDTNDDEEIALAIQAAEIAARQEARARFRNSSELIHKLFVCVSGVADQLQTNYASDLRHILKLVFECYSSYASEEINSVPEKCAPETGVTTIDASGPAYHLPQDSDSISSHSNQDTNSYHSNPDDLTPVPSPIRRRQEPTTVNNDHPPPWVPDEESLHCISCKVPFTFVRRRHHCRNCGKIFCGRCSSNSAPLPQYGHDKPVRVCNHCFIYQITPFMIGED